MQFTILLCGPSGVGKSSLLSRSITGDFKNDVHDNVVIRFQTNYGNISLEIIQSREYISGFDGEIIMFDLSNKMSIGNIGNVPVTNSPRVLIGNKSDLSKAKVLRRTIRYLIDGMGSNSPYYDISAKSLYNYEKPFVYLMRQLVAADLVLIETKAK
jgi:GTP-binding nuclear protein Ran